MAQSPSFHSSSYLPKMEASYLRDYNCCDTKLESLHDLIKHCEEYHSQASNQILSRNVGRPVGQHQQQQHQQQQNQQQPVTNQSNRPPPQAQSVNPFGTHQFDQFNSFSNQFGVTRTDDFSGLEEPLDMEMDDPIPTAPMMPTTGQVGRIAPNPTRFDHLNMNVMSGMSFGNAGGPVVAGAGTGPVGAGPGPQPSFRPSHVSNTNPLFPPLQNNPTVSSVNTPTFGPSGFQPAGPGTDSNAFAAFGSGVPVPPGISRLNSGIGSTNATAPNSAYATAANSTCNSPTRANSSNWHSNANALLNRLSGWQLSITREMEMTLAKQGFTIDHLQYAMVIRQARTDTTLAQKIRDLKTSGAPLGTLGMIFASDQESKPFKCPVVGCEKTYKNQNGLKYHRQHGHVNQTLQENVDGTFSIVDPETSAPYPGTIGMEKEKPYRCEVCGKRYKNLNGLKYHRQHQPMCNPDLKLESAHLEGFFVPPELEALAMNLIPPGSETEYIMAGLNAPAEGGIAPADMLKNRPSEMGL